MTKFLRTSKGAEGDLLRCQMIRDTHSQWEGSYPYPTDPRCSLSTMVHAHLLLRMIAVTPHNDFTTMARALTKKDTRIWPM